MYEDAHVLERELVEGGAEIVEDVPNEAAEVLLRESAASFGAGERAALSVFFVREADAALTDDRAFIGLLSGAEPLLPALVPTAAIVALAEADRMSFEEVQEALVGTKHSVREDALEAAAEDLNAMRKQGKNRKVRSDERDETDKTVTFDDTGEPDGARGGHGPLGEDRPCDGAQATPVRGRGRPRDGAPLTRTHQLRQGRGAPGHFRASRPRDRAGTFGRDRR